MNDIILNVTNLTKHFKTNKALDNISLSIEKGSVCGLLGPNGAGKTTLLRIITAILLPDSGEITIGGLPASLEVSRNIGYMPEERGLYDKMTVEDQILYFGRLKGGDTKRLREVMDEYLQLFNLQGQEKRKIKELSKGNQQKVQIISTIVHEPELVIFDEPFSGFDPINGQLLEQLLDRLHKKNVTIILSSHNMSAVEEICRDILLINKGKIVVHGNISDIKENFKTDCFLITTRRQLMLEMLNDTGLLKSIRHVECLPGRKGYAYEIVKGNGVSNNALLDAIAMQGEILQFEEKLPSLNDIFIRSVESDNAL